MRDFFFSFCFWERSAAINLYRENHSNQPFYVQCSYSKGVNKALITLFAKVNLDRCAVHVLLLLNKEAAII